MATPAQWVEGARPRTLPAAAAPVMAGTATAIRVIDRFTTTHVLLAIGALIVALALQVGVNYANDYSDGIRGTDDDRVGPLRLVGSGAASPKSVKLAAFACFGLAGIVGAALVIATAHWWLFALGAASILAAWFYTGGKRPYGYAGLGELFVFVFFGLVATVGTHYVLTSGVTVAAVIAGIGIGALACALLVANNLRDIPTDLVANKRTLATRLGDGGTRWFFFGLAIVAMSCVLMLAFTAHVWFVLAFVMALPLVPATRIIRSGATGRELIAVLKLTGIAELLMGAGLLLGALIG